MIKQVASRAPCYKEKAHLKARKHLRALNNGHGGSSDQESHRLPAYILPCCAILTIYSKLTWTMLLRKEPS